MKEPLISHLNESFAHSPLPDLCLPITPGIGIYQRENLFETWERMVSDQGAVIYISPTCDVSPAALNPDNWSKSTEMGYYRAVRSIDALQDGTNPHLVVKSPERIYNSDPGKLARGDIWYGGPRSLGKPLRMGIHSTIEAQVEREAIVLFALKEMRIPAEIPQAVIDWPDGTSEIVVKEINSSYRKINGGIRVTDSIEFAREAGFMLPDVAANFLDDLQGNDVLLGVNRWQIPPYTDNYHQNLVEAVVEEAVQNYEVAKQH
jgi:hypothetical protein